MKEKFKPVTMEDLELTEDELKLLVQGAQRFFGPGSEETVEVEPREKKD